MHNKRARPRYLAELLERRRLLSAAFALNGPQNIASTTPATFDNPATAGVHESEMEIAINPTDPLNVVMVTSLTATTSQADGGSEYWSTDGGGTWSRAQSLPNFNSDPSLAFDRSGRLFVSYMTMLPHDAGFFITILESTDKGQTFPNTYTLATVSTDKDWLTTGLDPSSGRQALYIGYSSAADFCLGQLRLGHRGRRPQWRRAARYCRDELRPIRHDYGSVEYRAVSRLGELGCGGSG